MAPRTRASVRDLRYRFPEIEKRLRRGETIEIVKRNRPVGTLIPAQPAAPAAYPDFRALQREIWGQRSMRVSATELLRQGRDGQ